MLLMMLITLGNVLVRYLTDRSFAWTEEISVYLLVVLTLAGSACAASTQSHIAIEFFMLKGSSARRHALRTLAAAATVGLFALVTVLIARAGLDEFHFGDTTPGLGVPRWWYTVWLVPLTAMIAWRALSTLLRNRGASVPAPQSQQEAQ